MNMALVRTIIKRNLFVQYISGKCNTMLRNLVYVPKINTPILVTANPKSVCTFIVFCSSFLFFIMIPLSEGDIDIGDVRDSTLVFLCGHLSFCIIFSDVLVE